MITKSTFILFFILQINNLMASDIKENQEQFLKIKGEDKFIKYHKYLRHKSSFQIYKKTI